MGHGPSARLTDSTICRSGKDPLREITLDKRYQSAYIRDMNEATTTITRDEAIRRIRTALKARTGRTWSVTGGRGTAWGWIRISAPPARLVGGAMADDDRALLALTLGKPDGIPAQGESIPASAAYYREYVDRAEGRPPTVTGTPYWD
jgi:hypothetical protein